MLAASFSHWLRALFRRPLLSVLPLLFLVLMSGCGWGGDPRDYALTITPSALTATQGGDSASISLSVRRIFYFADPVTVTFVPPAGIVCSLTPCAVTVTEQATSALHFTSSPTMPAGNYSIPWTAKTAVIAPRAGSLSLSVTAANTTGGGPTVTPDFSFTVSPSSSTVTAGSPAPPFSFSVTRSGGQVAPIRITAVLPSAWTCSVTPCGATVAGSSLSNVFAVTAAATVPAGTYAIAFTGTDGATTHTVTATITVTAAQGVTPPVTVTEIPSGCMVQPYIPTMPIGSDRQDFVYTGAQKPKGLAYDAVHNLIFVSNDNLNEVDVIDPNAMTLIHRIPVPGPTGVDLTADGKTLLVGSTTPAFFRIDTGTFCVTAREAIALDTAFFGTTEYTPYKLLSLADGSVALWMQETGVGAGYFAIWSGAAPLRIVSFNTGYLGCMLRSGDRQHVFLCGGDSGGLYGRYDVATGTLQQKTISFGDFPQIYAVNQDGSRILKGGSYGAYGLTLSDGNFNALALDAGGSGYGVIATPDFSRIYSRTDVFGNLWRVLDGKPSGTVLTNLGSIPGPLTYGQVDPTPYAFDGTGRILSTVEYGLGVLPAREPRKDVVAITLRSGYAPVNSGLTPDNPSAGLSTVVNGARFPANPTVYFSGVAGTASSLVTGGPFVGTQINTTAPLLDTDCANVEVSYPNAAAMEPLSYCYRPRVLFRTGTAGPASGGSTLTLFGMGFGNASFGNPVTTTTVRIGGVAATNVQVAWAGISPYALQLYILTATVPAGLAGNADIEVASPSGRTVLPKAFTYADNIETSLGSADPYELVFDSFHERILITDQAGKQLLVYSTSGKRMESPVALSAAPRSVAITPDGKSLLVTVGRDGLAILDASTLQLVKQVTVPANLLRINDPTQRGLVRVAALANGKAFLEFNNIYIGNTLLQYDLASSTFTVRTDQPLNGIQDQQDVSASADGMWAIAGASIYNTVKDSFSPQGYYFIGSAGMVASPDGSRFASSSSVYDSAMIRTAQLSDHDLVTDTFSAGFGGSGLSNGQFNAGSSLYAQRTVAGIGITAPTQPAVRLWDVPHGQMFFQMGLLGNTSPSGQDWQYRNLIAVDPRGQRFWTVTSRGLQDVQFAQDPLTAGAISVSRGVLSVKGSGFTTTMQATIDGQPVTANVSGTTAFTATLPNLSSGNHSLRLTDGPDRAYVLDIAFTTP